MKKSEAVKNQKQLQSEKTRQRIVQAAAELFVRKGFDGSSISDLARTTKLTKGAIYHHFRSKNALFFAVLQMVRESWAGAVVRDVLKTKNALDRIDLLLENHTRLVSENPTICLVMASLVTDADWDDTHSKFSAALREIYSELIKLTEHIIKKGQAAGEIRADVDARLVALNVVGMMRTTCCRLLDQFNTKFEKRMATLRRILVDGLRG